MVACGPLLLAVWAWPWNDVASYGIALAYEAVALAGTMLYARIGRAGGLFDEGTSAQAEGQ